MNNFIQLDKRDGHYAFTLIELLISATLMALVSVAVYSVFSNGMMAWHRGNRDRIYLWNIRQINQKLTEELRNVFKFSNIAFEGTKDSIRFPALIPVVLAEGKKSYNEVGRIAYFYDKKKAILYKEEKTYQEVFSKDKIDRRKIVIRHVKKLEFSYCYFDNATGKYKWKDDWKIEEQSSIPQAVKIKLIFENEGKLQEYDSTIFIPIGTGEQKIELAK